MCGRVCALVGHATHQEGLCVTSRVWGTLHSVPPGGRAIGGGVTLDQLSHALQWLPFEAAASELSSPQRPPPAAPARQLAVSTAPDGANSQPEVM